ncbi:MAG: glycerol-3-phosphate 1-O-acyltransferase PlsY [Oscillospiraceae bacterium]|nr:glycerol-3-phosphate 1-O-acyltransferase PlsY [Oscillospiraceae bacterium]
MEWICYIIMLVVPYLLGGINTSIIVTKIRMGKDIRSMGSGNAGLTNTLRTQGKAIAGIVLLGDVAKAVLSVIAVRLSFLYIGGIDTLDLTLGMNWIGYMATLMVVVGHVFPVYYGFKGGKGVLAAISAIFTLDWRSAVILLSIFIILVAITRYVSLGSCIASSCFFITALIFTHFIDNDPSGIINTILAACTAGLIVFMHRGNIQRLLTHTEKKLGEKAKT